MQTGNPTDCFVHPIHSTLVHNFTLIAAIICNQSATFRQGGWQLGSATISILSHRIMVLSTIGMTFLVIPVLVSSVVVAMVTAVTRLLPVRFKLIMFTRQILLKGIVDKFYEIY